MIKILCIGHSHIGAFVLANKDFPRDDVAFDFINLLEPRYLGEDHAIRFDEIGEDCREKAKDADIILLSLSGNEHHVLGIVASNRPFDFLLPGRDGDYVAPRHEIIPVALVRGTLERITSKRYYDFFSGMFEQPVYSVSPPPPILDTDHIRTYGGVFKEGIARRGVSPPRIRLKLWELYCSIIREWATEAGFRFVEVPSTNKGPEGYIHHSGLLHDPTHGNAWYGRNMVSHLIGQLEVANG